MTNVEITRHHGAGSGCMGCDPKTAMKEPLRMCALCLTWITIHHHGKGMERAFVEERRQQLVRSLPVAEAIAYR